MNLTVGGRFHVGMQTPDREIITHQGNFRAIVPLKKLVYTWILSGEGCDASSAELGETLVSIEFKDQGENTEISLTHEHITTDKA